MGEPFHTREIVIGDTRFELSDDGTILYTYVPDPNIGREGKEMLYASYDCQAEHPVFLLLRGVLGQAEITYKQGLPTPGPIIQEWCHTVGLRHQGCLLGAIRGCDGLPKEDPSKWLVRFLRACVLRAHVGDPRKAVSFMEWTDNVDIFRSYAKGFLNDFDRYPTHYTFHLLHASAILAHYYPKEPQKGMWVWFHERFCKKLHVHPETKEEMDARLNRDEATFGRDQKL